jgi:hypothetical protein
MHFSSIEKQLRVAWSTETASTWTSDNPARGQCSVTALVIQDLIGGDILKTRVGPHWHFYNSLQGKRVDFTASQFDQDIRYDDLPATRDEAMKDTSQEQYRILAGRLGLKA